LDGEEKTFNELAQELGVSYVRVQQIERKALRMLRKPVTANKLRDVRGG
jgi:DNA-directed RNA polymerase sigma subunit (sigma70/sigma32)